MKHTIDGHVEAVIDLINRYAFTKTAKQTLTLFSSHILVVILGVITSVINTRVLGPKDYGILAFFWVVIGFSVLFFRFGIFNSGGLLLAQEKEESTERELIGALLIVTILIGLGYSLFVFVSSFFIDSIFKTNINGILRVFSFILLILPFQFLVPQICQGTNKINQLAVFNLIPKVLYVSGVLIIFKFFSITVVALILLNLAALIIAVVIISYSFKPLFKNLKENLKDIWKKTIEYGFHIYLGQVADQSTYKLGGLLISYFVNTTQLGFYSLAGAITLPMPVFSQSLATSLFKGFANKDRIPKKVFQFNFLWLIGCVVGLVLLGKTIVVFLFTDKFIPVVSFILPLAMAGFFQGMYQPYNMFLGAHGKGKWMRNMAIIMAIVNLLGNITFVPLWGAMGAAIAIIFGTLSYYLSCLWYYNRFMKELK